MPQRTALLLPATGRRLAALGERIRLARLRRKITAAHLAERAGMAPMTLRGIERGTQSRLGAIPQFVRTNARFRTRGKLRHRRQSDPSCGWLRRWSASAG